MKKKKRKKKIKKEISQNNKKKETKIFWIIMVALFIGSVSLAPELWIGSGKILWALVPIIAIGGLWSVFNAKQGEWIDKGMFLVFIGLIALGFILIIFIK
jgi:fatty acid desaturase|tara:strand:+ start:409 stop:708 length:300 start_codon:yes stop_codon:yes gene_type:complete